VQKACTQQQQQLFPLDNMVLPILLYESLVAEARVVLKIWIGGFWSPRPLPSEGSKKKKAEYRPVGRGVRWVRSLPPQAPEVPSFADQLFKTK